MRGMAEIQNRGKGKKYQVRFAAPEAGRVKISAFYDLPSTKRLADHIDLLISAKHNGDPPPRELNTWIANMPERISKRLVEVGLLDRRRGEVGRPLFHDDSIWDEKRRADELAKEDEKKRIKPSHVDDYYLAVLSRKNNTQEHALVMARNVLRVLKACQARYTNDLNDGDVLRAVTEFNVSPNTRRHYLTSCKDFTDWLKWDKRIGEDPLRNVDLPLADADPTFERVPLTVDQFRQLNSHMVALIERGGKYSKLDNSRWPAEDRRMVYWTAVCTGLRQDELRQLRGSHLLLTEKPLVEIKARNAKNKKAEFIPIPLELASALKEYTKNLHPASMVFSIPVGRKNVVNHFRRDLKEAGILIEDLGDRETYDFHSLRATAITWWLDVYNLSIKQAQVLARVSSPHLIARYSKKFKLASTDWIQDAPSLTEPVKPESKNKVV